MERHIWKSTELYDLFSSSLEILDEMRPIRLIEHTNRAKVAYWSCFPRFFGMKAYTSDSPS